MPITVGELKNTLRDVDDHLPVVFEWQENGHCDTSYSADKTEEKHGFFILISVD